MTATENPRQGVTLLQFLRVVPSSAWLRASILWADDLAAIWPMREPTPLDRAQEQPLQEVWSLLNAGLFQRKYLADLFHPAEGAAQILDEAGNAGRALHGEDWKDGGPAVGPSPGPTVRQRSEYDLDTFMYPDKLPDEVTGELARRRWIKARPDGSGYTVVGAKLLNQLLAVYARVLQEQSAGCLLPDVEEPNQARRIAAPFTGGDARQALVLAVRGAVKPDLKTDFRHFIDFRTDDKNERARRDYIEHLVALWDLCARGGPENARQQVLGRVAVDLRRARESYFKRVTTQMLTVQTLTSFGVVIPLTAAHPPAAVIGALATVGASVATVTVRNSAPRYIRRAAQFDLLAPTAL